MFAGAAPYPLHLCSQEQRASRLGTSGSAMPSKGAEGPGAVSLPSGAKGLTFCGPQGGARGSNRKQEPCKTPDLSGHLDKPFLFFFYGRAALLAAS